jgi:hypothetical protein
VSQDLSTHAKESISSLEGLQKASEWEHSHVYVSYEKFGSLGLEYATFIIKHAVCGYVVMLVYSSPKTICLGTLMRAAFLDPGNF